MKEAIIVDLDGNFVGVTLVADDVTGVSGIHETPSVEIPESEPVLIGYQVAVNRPEGLYSYKFNLEAEEWVEGLTPEEIAVIKHTPKTPSDAEQLAQLQEVVNMLLMEGLG